MDAEASRKEGEVLTFLVFSSYKKLPLSHSKRRPPATGGSHRVAGETGFNQPLWQPTKDIKTAGQAGEVAGEVWNAAKRSSPTLTSPLSNPKLVQIVIWDCSVSVVWPEPSCDLNTEK